MSMSRSDSPRVREVAYNPKGCTFCQQAKPDLIRGQAYGLKVRLCWPCQEQVRRDGGWADPPEEGAG